MPAAKPMTATDVAEIQRRMAQVRHDMHQEVQGAVQSAQLLTDWRSLVGSYPWLAMSLTALVGYALVPRRSHPYPWPSTPSPAILPVAQAAAQVQQKPRKGWNMVGVAFSLLGPVAVRAAQNYALNHLEKWLSQHPLVPAPTGAQDASQPGSGQMARNRPAPRFGGQG